MTIEELFNCAEQTGVDGSFTRVDESHPLDLFLGLEAGRRAIMVICPRRPPEAPSLGALSVEARPRQSGWALIIRLERPDLRMLFSRLAEDLVDFTRANNWDPGEMVVTRLTRWQRLFSRRPSSLLDDQELRGLAAELSFLVDEAVPRFGPETALLGWGGPFDAPKDFSFQGVEVEVKATLHQRRAVRISSLEQLTDAGRPIFLWCRVVELEHKQEPADRTVTALVRKVREVVAGVPAAADRLEEALRAAGWEDRPEYDARVVHFGPVSCYEVRAEFPRIQRTLTPAAIAEASYEIATVALEPFLRPTWWEAETSAY